MNCSRLRDIANQAATSLQSEAIRAVSMFAFHQRAIVRRTGFAGKKSARSGWQFLLSRAEDASCFAMPFPWRELSLVGIPDGIPSAMFQVIDQWTI
jgi:hypothetical protein